MLASAKAASLPPRSTISAEAFTAIPSSLKTVVRFSQSGVVAAALHMQTRRWLLMDLTADEARIVECGGKRSATPLWLRLVEDL